MKEFKSHSGDCTIYSSLTNGSYLDGVCTCGYGWQEVRKLDPSHMYSEERLEDLHRQKEIKRVFDLMSDTEERNPND